VKLPSIAVGVTAQGRRNRATRRVLRWSPVRARWCPAMSGWC